jgi:hypothetical protein
MLQTQYHTLLLHPALLSPFSFQNKYSNTFYRCLAPLVTRPTAPVPLTSARFTLFSRAMRRTVGEARMRSFSNSAGLSAPPSSSSGAGGWGTSSIAGFSDGGSGLASVAASSGSGGGGCGRASVAASSADPSSWMSKRVAPTCTVTKLRIANATEIGNAHMTCTPPRNCGFGTASVAVSSRIPPAECLRGCAPPVHRYCALRNLSHPSPEWVKLRI